MVMIQDAKVHKMQDAQSLWCLSLRKASFLVCVCVYPREKADNLCEFVL